MAVFSCNFIKPYYCYINFTLKIFKEYLNLRDLTFIILCSVDPNKSNYLQLVKQKKFYNRGAISALHCEIQWMSFIPSYRQFKWLSLFLIQGYAPIMIQGRDLSQSWNVFTPYCCSSVESLLVKVCQEKKIESSLL